MIEISGLLRAAFRLQICNTGIYFPDDVSLILIQVYRGGIVIPM